MSARSDRGNPSDGLRAKAVDLLDLDTSPPEGDGPAPLEVAKDAVDRGPGGAGQLGERLLRKGNRPVVELGQLREPPDNALVRGQVVGLGELLGEAAHALAQDRDEDGVDARVLAAQPLEVLAEDGARLGGLERLDGRGPLMLVRDEGELAERVSRPRTASVAVSPSGVVIRTANRPLEIRWRALPGSPRWKTTSPRANVRRLAIVSTARTVSCGTSEKSAHSMVVCREFDTSRVVCANDGETRVRSVAAWQSFPAKEPRT